MPHKCWSPADGPDAAPQQIPHVAPRLFGDGRTERASGDHLWSGSEGPMRSDPGGPGGEPDGKTIPQPGRSPLDEQ